METNVISVKYEDKMNPKTFSGKSYSYYTDIEVDVGDFVIAPTIVGEKTARVSRINIPEDEISSIKQELKTITKKLDKKGFYKDYLIAVNENQNEDQVANILIENLVRSGFVVHRYNAYTTNSIYLKLDCGVSCAIRIADHLGKKKYQYRFNVIKDYKGNRVVKRNNLVSYFYTFQELDEVLDAVKQEKEYKLNKYGLENYNNYMKQNLNKEIYNNFFEVEEAS